MLQLIIHWNQKKISNSSYLWTWRRSEKWKCFWKRYKLTIYLRSKGKEISSDSSEYNEKEELTLVPYVIDLEKIRDSKPQFEYISQALVNYKYIINIINVIVVSNKIIFWKYNACLYKSRRYKRKISKCKSNDFNNRFFIKNRKAFFWWERFKTYFFTSYNTMQYYVNANPVGRLLNNPTSLEIPSCNAPYYYILNYH